MAVFRLPRLNFKWKDQPELFERYWDNSMTAIERAISQLQSLPIIQDAIANLDAATLAAQTAADNANAAAVSAQSGADAARIDNSLINSYPSNFTAPLISADSAGNVTIANHDRVYGDPVMNPTVAVTGATIATGATALQVVRVWYTDPSRSGGAVTYLFTVDPTPPTPQTGNNHSVGAVTIPTAGTNSGNGVRPPGFVEP